MTATAMTLAGATQVRDAMSRVRVYLRNTLVGRSLLMAAATGVIAALVVRLALLLPIAPFAPSHTLRTLLSWVLPVALATGVLLWRFLQQERVTPVRAALWYEERKPCAHAVVTLIEQPGGALSEQIASQLARQAAIASHDTLPARAQLREARWKAWRVPGALLLVASMCWPVVTAIQSRALPSGVGEAALSATGNASRTGAVNRLSDWQVRVTPPSYAGLPTQSLSDVGTVRALTGSRVLVSGNGNANGLSATLGEQTLSVSGNNGWQVSVIMPNVPSAVRVADGAQSRVLTLVPYPDSLPQVQLLAPLRDSVYRDTVGTATLSAQASDDIGLQSLAFEVILTRASGEQYTARTFTVGEAALNGSRNGGTRYALSFAGLNVAPGDVMHVRAIARDLHPFASREPGVSETRSIRFARADEYDSVAVEAAPPPVVDSSLLSQRMLLDLTEKLEVRRPRIAREVLVSESRKLATEQARIRRAVSAMVFQRLTGEGESEHVHYEGDGHDHGLTAQAGKLVPGFGGSGVVAMPGAQATGASGQPNNNATDESAIVAINRPLLEAYNAMWDAGRALELADTREAIPHMRLALDAIQRARAAERIYLRGRVRPIVVDLARVRLAGKDTGQDSRRSAGEPMTSARDMYGNRLLRASEQLLIDPVAARDSLVALRIDALADDAELSAALEVVLTALQAGNDVTAPLVRARRSLLRPVAGQGVPSWSVP